jgi:ferritin-like metal-binding protein YciE
MMGHSRDVILLNSTLDEEKAADEKLTNIAHSANAMAA